ncbi:Alanine and proline rich secreted protein Apa (fibronectin attachment protein) (Immunogenic protein MPT32) (Antigen MPT-32) (45-kDa glycoprotein) (45/47 kDa antigen) [Mycobacterium tuberculosis CAS/NITR204]|uniref:Alanine and proline-rich secreted protein Apa n=1 Tax=Mycobacterium tuberculosis CAS/NITR204 TaxID=1310114 RepID=R4M6J8_MYCTX|nr:Alanine and proline rich secreted protein Apa (fibronectin attachment protein) (Immunogenic protein MPT32) (Antigen MPT-32) (45-kDa glycoprotein) (45/47 kDa antigen) [Mycobacterium tuberculosis CAS/NITR204]
MESDAAHLDYGSALLSKTTGDPPFPGQPPPVANDTRIVLGRLDQKLYASAEATDSKAAARLGSDMGEFYMPYPGTRINQETVSLDANGVSGSASYYEVKFSDPSKPNGQIWTGVIGSPAANAPDAGPPQRWFVVWLGTANNPVDKGMVQVGDRSGLWSPRRRRRHRLLQSPLRRRRRPGKSLLPRRHRHRSGPYRPDRIRPHPK